MYNMKWLKGAVRVGGVIVGLKLIEVLLIGSGCYGVNKHIETHLDSNAVHCGFVNNVLGYMNINVGLPRMQNSDVNNDGCLESILLCNVKNGVKMYQKVELNDGVESLGPIAIGRF
jgi:hypothetical protein